MERATAVDVTFSSLTDGANSSRTTSSKCILKNWDMFDPQNFEKTCLIFFYDTEWSHYPLEDGEHWPVEESQL